MIRDRFFSDINVDSNSGLTFVFLHEIAHNIFDHKARGEGKDPHLWIYATDYFINLFLWNLEKENSGCPKTFRKLLSNSLNLAKNPSHSF